LIKKQATLQEENAKLLQMNRDLHQEMDERQRRIQDLESKYESLRVARTMVGSKEDKHVTKLKINALIREIDRCIVELSD
jgi:chromosome segregation ATPase